MLPPVQHMHVRRWVDDRADMARSRIPMLSEGGRVRPQRPETEGAEGGQTEQAGVRGHVHDGGQGLGGRVDLWPNYHRPHPGKGSIIVAH